MTASATRAALFSLVWIIGCARDGASPTAATAPLEPVEARASVDRAVATPGDVITYTVTIDYEPTYAVDVPEPGAEIAGLRVIDLGRKAEEVNGRVVDSRWYKLRADLVGSYIVPAVRVRYWPKDSPPTPGAMVIPAELTGQAKAKKKGKARKRGKGKRKAKAKASESAGSNGEDEADTSETEDPPAASAEDTAQQPRTFDLGDGSKAIITSEIFIEVASVLPQEGDVNDIRDIKPLQPMPQRVPWILIAGAAIALLLIAGVLWRFRKPKESSEEAPLPPHEEAFLALDDLRATDFNDPEAVRRYYFVISEVIRNYIERRFWLNATDLTTQEILPQIPDLRLPGSCDRDLRSFLHDTDLVKYASHEPEPEEIRAIYERALRFVEGTVPAPQPGESTDEAPVEHDTATRLSA